MFIKQGTILFFCEKIMKSQSSYKVPNGKLLKVFLEYDEHTEVIKNIRITGDFFAYPEEAIEQLEKQLRDTPLDQKNLSIAISSFLEKHQVEFIGLNAEWLTKGILRCKQ